MRLSMLSRSRGEVEVEPVSKSSRPVVEAEPQPELVPVAEPEPSVEVIAAQAPPAPVPFEQPTAEEADAPAGEAVVIKPVETVSAIDLVMGDDEEADR